MAGLNIDWSGFATLSKMDMQQCPKIFCNFVQKVLAKNMKDYIYYSILSMRDSEKILIGPVRICKEKRDLDKYMVDRHHLHNDCTYKLAYCDLQTFVNSILLLNFFLNGQQIHISELYKMNGISDEVIRSSEHEINNIIFYHQEMEVPHNSFDHEARKLDSIQNGELESLIKCQKEVWVGQLGKVARDPVRQAKNIAIITIVLASRAAIKGGASPELAFSMADGFILNVEDMNDLLQIQATAVQSEIEFATAVKHLKKTKDPNILVEKAKDYILKHLHSNIRIKDIAMVVGVNKDYLSFIFSRKEGVTLQNYICREKIKQSEHLLRYSKLKIDEISNQLSFSSQSHFGHCFKKIIGMTPSQYRNRHAIRQI